MRLVELMEELLSKGIGLESEETMPENVLKLEVKGQNLAIRAQEAHYSRLAEKRVKL